MLKFEQHPLVFCVSGEPVAYFGDANGYTNFEVSVHLFA